MGRGGPAAESCPQAEPDVYFFERSEEADEGTTQAIWDAARLAEIAMAELIGPGDYSGAHGPVFVCTLHPNLRILLAIGDVHPQREPHVYNYGPGTGFTV